MAPRPQSLGGASASPTPSPKPDQPQVDDRTASIVGLSVLAVYVLLLLIAGVCLLAQFISRRSRRSKPVSAHLRSYSLHASHADRPVSTASNASFLVHGANRKLLGAERAPVNGAEVGTRGAGRDGILSPPPEIEVYVESPERTTSLAALGMKAPLIPMQGKAVSHPDTLRHEQSGYSLRDAAGYGESDSDSETVKGRGAESDDVSPVSIRRVLYPEEYEDHTRP